MSQLHHKNLLEKNCFLDFTQQMNLLATFSPFVFIYNILLPSNSEDREHLKNSRNVDCVQTNHNKVQDTQANLKTTI